MTQLTVSLTNWTEKIFWIKYVLEDIDTKKHSLSLGTNDSSVAYPIYPIKDTISNDVQKLVVDSNKLYTIFFWTTKPRKNIVPDTAILLNPSTGHPVSAFSSSTPFGIAIKSFPRTKTSATT